MYSGINSRLWASTALTSLLAISLASAALAAEQKTAAADQKSKGGLEEIVVTAQRKSENLQVVPMSVVALGATQIQRSGAFTIQQLNGLVPNAVIERVSIFTNASSLSMRGVGTTGIESFADPEVATYVNGVYQPRSATGLLTTLDASNVEVLRGPQGTLYGRNAFAGVIAMTTNRPTMDEFEGKGTITYANYNRVDADLVVNAPLIQNELALRLAGRVHSSDGYFENNGVIDLKGTIDPSLKGRPVVPEKTYYVRPTLRWTPNANLDVNVIGDVYIDRSAAGVGINLFQPGVLVNTLGPGVTGANIFGDQSLGIPAAGGNPFKSVGSNGTGWPSYIDQGGVTVDSTYNTSIGKFKFIGNWASTKEEIWTDTDGTNLNIFSSARWQDYRVYSGELQYTTKIDRLDLTSGAFFLADKYQTTQLSFTVPNPLPAGFAGLAPVFVPTIIPAVQSGYNNAYINNSGERETWALYAQGEYHITDQLSLVGGGRYSWERKFNQMGESTTVLGAGFGPGTDFSAHLYSPAASGLVFGPISNTWDAFSPRVGVNYKINDDVLLFGFWQRASKSGGYNANAADLTAFRTPFGQETVDNYEGGIKSEWFDHKLRVNVNAFYETFTDLQRTLVTPSATAASGVVTVTTNAGNAVSYGTEIELAARPWDSVTTYANIGFDRAYYSKYCAPVAGLQQVTTSLTGHPVCGPITTVVSTAGKQLGYLVPTDFSYLKLIRAPKWDISFGGSKEFAIQGKGLITLNAGATYRSTWFTNLTNVPYSFRPDSITADASLRWDPDTSRYSVTLWARNITNNIYLINYTPAGSFTFGMASDPRTLGITVDVRF
jgi:iron complex outermembrane receptor protein